MNRKTFNNVVSGPVFTEKIVTSPFFSNQMVEVMRSVSNMHEKIIRGMVLEAIVTGLHNSLRCLDVFLWASLNYFWLDTIFYFSITTNAPPHHPCLGYLAMLIVFVVAMSA